MEAKEYLLNELHVPAQYLKSLDFSDFPQIIKGTPEWASYYKILNWIDEKPIENRDAFDRFVEYCHVAAAKDFDEKILDDNEILNWFNLTFRIGWAWIFMDAARLCGEGREYIPSNGRNAILFYEKAYQLDNEIIGAFNGIGDIYYQGIGGVSPDYQKALECFQRTENHWRLGDYYSEGIAVAPDYPLAISHYLKELEMYEKGNPPEWASFLHEKLTKCYESIGDAQKAAEHSALILKE